jgi:hypothetical protein
MNIRAHSKRSRGRAAGAISSLRYRIADIHHCPLSMDNQSTVVLRLEFTKFQDGEGEMPFFMKLVFDSNCFYLLRHVLYRKNSAFLGASA